MKKIDPNLLPPFPIDVPVVELESITLPTDYYAMHVLPFMLEKIRAGKNVPVLAIRRKSDDWGSMLIVRELHVPTGQSVSMSPQFNNPLPGSTTVVWAATRGSVRVWFERGKRPTWIQIAGRDKAEVLRDMEAEAAL